MQVLNNFTNFYITHQIFFLTFTILFILHPIPGLSHVHGRRTYLPVTYSWVGPCLPCWAHAPALVAHRQHLLRPCSVVHHCWQRTLGMHECLLPGRLPGLAGLDLLALYIMHENGSTGCSAHGFRYTGRASLPTVLRCALCS